MVNYPSISRDWVVKTACVLVKTASALVKTEAASMTQIVKGI